MVIFLKVACVVTFVSCMYASFRFGLLDLTFDGIKAFLGALMCIVMYRVSNELRREDYD